MSAKEGKREGTRDLDPILHKIMIDDLYKMIQILDRGKAMEVEDFQRFLVVSRDFWKIRCGLTNTVEQSGS